MQIEKSYRAWTHVGNRLFQASVHGDDRKSKRVTSDPLDLFVVDPARRWPLPFNNYLPKAKWILVNIYEHKANKCFSIITQGIIEIQTKDWPKKIEILRAPCIWRLRPHYKLQSKLSYPWRYDTIKVFFFAATKNKDNAVVSLASSNS